MSGSVADLRASRRRTGSVDRLPPHSTEAEQGVLGCVLLEPAESMPECITKLRGASEAFYDIRHQAIFRAMEQMAHTGAGIDVITLQQHLKDQQLLDSVGGTSYLSELPDRVPSAANLSYYLDIVHEKYLLRRMLQACTNAVARVYESEGKVDELMDQVERDVLAVREAGTAPNGATGRELVQRVLARFEDSMARAGKPDGLSTGFPDWDSITGGLQNAELTIIGGFPTTGKTALAMNVVDNVAIGQGAPVGVFSLEMSAETLMMRAICSRARVNSREVRNGRITEDQFRAMAVAAELLAKAPINWEDSSDISATELRAKARRLKQRNGIRLVVVDYLQLVNGARRSGDDTREQEVSGVAHELKAMAMELNVPVIALSQLNDDGKLRESRAIGQHADNVARLKTVRTDGDANEDFITSETVPMEFRLLKQRNGPTGSVPLTFMKCFTRYESAAKETPETRNGNNGQ